MSHSIMSSPDTPNKNKPYRWLRKNTVSLPKPVDGEYPQFFSGLLEKVIEDQRRKNSGNQTLQLKNGKRLQEQFGAVAAYSFEFEGKAEPIEGAEITLNVESNRVEGSIVGLTGGRLLVAIKEDLGEVIPKALLLIDNTALLRKLKARFEAISENGDSFSEAAANKAFGIDSPSITVRDGVTVSGYDQLNAQQKKAVDIGLGSDLLYLWGPPGTGKSATLSVLIRQLYAEGKRIFISSNTNFAVDGVLKSVVKSLGQESDPGLADGRVLRLGAIFDQELASSEFSELITPEAVADRKSVVFQEEKDGLEAQVQKLEDQKKPADEALQWYDKTHQLKKDVKTATTAQFEVENEERSQALRLKSSKAKHEQALEKLANWDRAGKLRRLLLGKRESHAERVKFARNDLLQMESELREKQADVKSCQHRLQQTQSALAVQESFRPSLAEDEARSLSDQLGEKIISLQKRIQEINAILAQMLAKVLAGCQILAATVHQTYIRDSLMDNFDVVVIDEASMIQLPALYHCCGLAKQSIVIAGDFRQLPPISNTEEESLWQWMGRDIFDKAGVVQAVGSGEEYPSLVMLEEQYRMDDSICQCISTVFYEGKLRTGDGRMSSDHPKPPACVSDRLILVDTSQVVPYCQKNSNGSKYNMLHAVAAREMVSLLNTEGFIQGKGSVGICTPFAAQACLTKELIRDGSLENLVTVGSVHTYQGDEKELMILDFPDGDPEKNASMWARHDDLSDDGAKLFNVAVSRAKEYLVVIANLAFMEQKLPAKSFLRQILYDIQERGTVVNVLDLLQIDSLPDTANMDFTNDGFQRGVWFTESTFRETCRMDIAQARQSIVIFSGFITGRRTKDWYDLLAEKVKAGVQVKCITRPPSDNPNPTEAKRAMNNLRQAGIIVDSRINAHQKAVLVDGEILWLGSLNPLSFTEHSRELMVRVNAPNACQELARFGCIKQPSRKEDNPLGLLLAKENPDCPKCGGLMFFGHSKRTKSDFFRCIECGEYANPERGLNKSSQNSSGAVNQEDPQKCSKCGKEMVLRNGKRGKFWGCSGFPACRETKSL